MIKYAIDIMSILLKLKIRAEEEIQMTDSFTTSTTEAAKPALPRYRVIEFGNAASIENWFHENPDYSFLSMAPVSVTNHFSKETETSLYVIAQRCDPK